MKLSTIIRPHKHIPEALKERSAFKLVGRDPHVDWLGILLIAVIVSAALIVMGSYVYLNVGNSVNELSSSAAPSSKASIEMRKLDAVLKEYDKRAEMRNELLRGYAGPGDPSF